LDTPVIVNARSLVAAMSPPGRVGDARSIASLRDIDDLFPDTPRHWLPLPEVDQHGTRYGHMVMHGDRLVDVDRLAARLAALGEPSLRLKGIARVEGSERRQRLDFTNGVLTIEPVELAEPPATGFVTAVFLDRGDVRRKLQVLAPAHLVED